MYEKNRLVPLYEASNKTNSVVWTEIYKEKDSFGLLEAVIIYKKTCERQSNNSGMM